LNWLRPFIVGLLPAASQQLAAGTFGEMGARMCGYVRGVVFNMFVIGVLSGLAVWLLGVPYPIALGVLAGLTEAIPLLGPIVGGAVAALIAFSTGGVIQGPGSSCGVRDHPTDRGQHPGTGSASEGGESRS
jgi:predicted PurR-regulated permease PerM